MDIRPIETESDYEWALKEIEPYFINEPVPHSPEADRFSVLSALISVYEDKHWSIEAPDPVDAILEFMDQKLLKQTDLSRILGSRSRASELLARKRALTMEQAWKLHQAWHIPAEVLLRPITVTKPA
jgi:HTH-type transcriptional regulator/antitoxin HigA